MDEQPTETPVQTAEPAAENTPLAYEETPVIEPVAETPAQAAPPEPSPPVIPPTTPPPPAASREAGSGSARKHSSFLGIIGNILLFVVLFGVGIWLSTIIRQYLPTGLGQGTQPIEETEPRPTARVTPTPTDPYRGWQVYQVISSATRQPVGISFKLPADVLSPICDGTSCMSQGTYLSGGTRFTVALRGPGMALRDFRGRVITDVNGTEFTTEQSTVVGREAVKFTGSFSGRTVTGYAFTRMHGYMVEVNDTLSLEINHFTPAGLTADFESDHMVFESVVKSLTFEGYPATTSKGATMPVLTPQTAPTTSPGY